MRSKFILCLLSFSSLIFSCAHKVTYKVSINSDEKIKQHYDIDGKLEANNLENYKLKIIPHFCYVITREDIAVEINNKAIEPFKYAYNNYELDISHNLIDGDISITVENIDLRDDYQIIHNADEAKTLSYLSIDATVSSGSYINVDHPDITFTLITDGKNKVPSEQKIRDGITPSDERFYKQGVDIIFNKKYDQHVDFTIPSKMLGCNIEVRIPEATI